MSGESLNKTADKLADKFQVSKFQATTLVRTETAHIHNEADFQAYKDVGIKRYKYLATLDYATCGTCQPLDGMVFDVSQRQEGVNAPVMHPRCRCTTTPDVDYANRRARDPITGKSSVIDGSVTYEQWVKNMTSQQKSALELARKKDSRASSDKVQYVKYRNALGLKTMPSSFDKFQDLKYNDVERWKEIKALYREETKPYLQKRLDYILQSGEKNFIPTGAVMTSARTIAGKGSKTDLRVEDNLINAFGGQRDEWKTRVGKIESEKYIFDVHWYELDGKQYRVKLKYRGDRK